MINDHAITVTVIWHFCPCCEYSQLPKTVVSCFESLISCAVVSPLMWIIRVSPCMFWRQTLLCASVSTAVGCLSFATPPGTLAFVSTSIATSSPRSCNAASIRRSVFRSFYLSISIMISVSIPDIVRVKIR